MSISCIWWLVNTGFHSLFSIPDGFFYHLFTHLSNHPYIINNIIGVHVKFNGAESFDLQWNSVTHKYISFGSRDQSQNLLNVGKHFPTELHSQPKLQPALIFTQRLENDNSVVRETQGYTRRKTCFLLPPCPFEFLHKRRGCNCFFWRLNVKRKHLTNLFTLNLPTFFSWLILTTEITFCWVEKLNKFLVNRGPVN